MRCALKPDSRGGRRPVGVGDDGRVDVLVQASARRKVLYIKLILRNDCIVVSFHEDEGDGHEERDA